MSEQPQPTLSRRLNVYQAAEYLGLSSGTLNRMRIKANGPLYYKLGRKILYDTTDLDRYLESKLQRSTADNRK